MIAGSAARSYGFSILLARSAWIQSFLKLGRTLRGKQLTARGPCSKFSVGTPKIRPCSFVDGKPLTRDMMTTPTITENCALYLAHQKRLKSQARFFRKLDALLKKPHRFGRIGIRPQRPLTG